MSGPASEHAARQHPGAPLKWKQLELAAWRDHPRVLTALDPAGHPTRGAGVALLGAAVLFIAPVLELAGAIGAGRIAFDVVPALALDTRVRISGVSAVLALAGQVVALLGWRAGPRHRDGFLRGHAVFCAVAGLVAVFVCVRARDEVDGAALYAVPAAVSIVAGLAVAALMALAPAAPPKQQGPTRGGIPAAVAALTDAERAGVSADLEAALDDLLARGVISARERAKVRGAPLGMLTVTLSSSRKRTSLD